MMQPGKNKYFFISDVHLGLDSYETEKNKEKKLISFLETAREKAVKLFIVGDLFDCWIEYRKVVPKGYYRLLAKLNELKEEGIEIDFYSGNHDFWLNTYLRDDVGLNLKKDFDMEIIEGKKFLITHGDGLSERDWGYKIIKRILRNKVNQFLYSLIHPDIGIWLAQKSSKSSREYNNENSFGSSGMKKFAEKKIREGLDYIIMGHYHNPQLVSIETDLHKGTYVTLGDWIKHFTYGVFAEGKFEIKKFGN